MRHRDTFVGGFFLAEKEGRFHGSGRGVAGALRAAGGSSHRPRALRRAARSGRPGGEAHRGRGAHGGPPHRTVGGGGDLPSRRRSRPAPLTTSSSCSRRPSSWRASRWRYAGAPDPDASPSCPATSPSTTRSAGWPRPAVPCASPPRVRGAARPIARRGRGDDPQLAPAAPGLGRARREQRAPGAHRPEEAPPEARRPGEEADLHVHRARGRLPHAGF